MLHNNFGVNEPDAKACPWHKDNCLDFCYQLFFFSLFLCSPGSLIFHKIFWLQRVSYLTPANYVHLGGQHVHHLAFSLIAPLSAQDNIHLGLVHVGSSLMQLLVVISVNCACCWHLVPLTAGNSRHGHETRARRWSRLKTEHVLFL